MANKQQLIQRAEDLGITLDPSWTKVQISQAIKDHNDQPQGDEPESISFTGKKLVEFDRHITGPPRRSKGQRVWITPELAKRQGLKPRDFHLVTR